MTYVPRISDASEFDIAALLERLHKLRLVLPAFAAEVAEPRREAARLRSENAKFEVRLAELEGGSGDGVSERIIAVAEGIPVAAFIDLVGGGYVELALELGIDRNRIDRIVDFPAIAKYGVKGDGGATAASAATLAELADAIAAGYLVVPIQRTYPLDDVRAAFDELEAGHMAGKIVLIP
jgi:NADPH:quinone reductase-like Zn-dependent oxidoreductase